MITHPFIIEPNALAIALPDEQVVLCHEVLGQAGLRVHRTDHVMAACERITELLPQVVVISTGLRHDFRDMIEDRAVAVGSVLIELDPRGSFEAIARGLDDAVATARRRLERKPRQI